MRGHKSLFHFGFNKLMCSLKCSRFLWIDTYTISAEVTVQPTLSATRSNNLWNCATSSRLLSTKNLLFIKLCWLHGAAFASTRRRSQECVFLYWKTFPCETFLCAQWSYQEFYHLKKVQEVWLSHLRNVFFLLTNWDPVWMYSQT